MFGRFGLKPVIAVDQHEAGSLQYANSQGRNVCEYS